MNLIQYVASYGDLLPPTEPEAKHSSSSQRTKVGWGTDSITQLTKQRDANTVCSGQVELPARPASQPPLAETEQQMLQDLMSEAMEETDGQHMAAPQQNGDHLALGFIQFVL